VKGGGIRRIDCENAIELPKRFASLAGLPENFCASEACFNRPCGAAAGLRIFHGSHKLCATAILRPLMNRLAQSIISSLPLRGAVRMRSGKD